MWGADAGYEAFDVADSGEGIAKLVEALAVLCKPFYGFVAVCDDGKIGGGAEEICAK